MKKKIDRFTILYGLAILCLFLYPLRHIWLGVEVTDTAYSAGNYKFTQAMNDMWLFATYLANRAGQFFTSLPGGDILIGLNFYTALVISILAIGVFLFLKNTFKMHAGVAFLSELLAISLCWCPTTILYNYLTYLFFGAGAVFMMYGLLKDQKKWLFVAGIFLGLNVMVRFPNITECALIFPLIYYDILMHKRLHTVLEEIGSCILGFFAGIGIVLLEITARYGLTAYVDGITSLLQMPSDASDYSLYSMVVTVLLDYKASSRWFLCILALVVVASLVSMLFWKLCKREVVFEGELAEELPLPLALLGKTLFIGAFIAMVYWWKRLGVFNLLYYTYESMFQWVAVFLLLTIVLCLYVLVTRQHTRGEKLFAAVVLVVLAVTPLGSNNHLYPNMNNMFLVFPFTLHILYQKWEEYRWVLATEGHFGIRSLFPVKAGIGLFLLLCSIQILAFGTIFTFRDGMSGQKRNTKVENNAILKGMVTNEELAESIASLTEWIDKEGLGDRKVLLYGQIPGVSYFLDMAPAISTTWPDLRSYNYGVMVEDMRLLEESAEAAEKLPLVIFGAEAEITAEDPKAQLIFDFMKKHGYVQTFTNPSFILYTTN